MSPAFAPLASCLPQLRALRLALSETSHFAAVDLRALQALTQLRQLRLDRGVAADVCDDDLAALVRLLCRLRALELGLWLPSLSPGALVAVGAAWPQLRHLLLSGGHDLGTALNSMSATPLFPCLENLLLPYLHCQPGMR
jgi:hypothetical protein